MTFWQHSFTLFALTEYSTPALTQTFGSAQNTCAFISHCQPFKCLVCMLHRSCACMNPWNASAFRANLETDLISAYTAFIFFIPLLTLPQQIAVKKKPMDVTRREKKTWLAERIQAQNSFFSMPLLTVPNKLLSTTNPWMQPGGKNKTNLACFERTHFGKVLT